MHIVKRVREVLIQQGADSSELSSLARYPTDVTAFWNQCEDAPLMVRVAGAAGIDPVWSVAVACDCAAAVLHYVGGSELRPRQAIEAAQQWMQGQSTSEHCLAAAEAAEQAGNAYREARNQTERSERRAYRAAAYAAYAAARAARAAATAAVVSEIDYDGSYTFDDAWSGARMSCANEAALVVHDVIEAAVSATAARIAAKTGSDMAGRAAAHEARPEANRWATELIRKRISAELVAEAAGA